MGKSRLWTFHGAAFSTALLPTNTLTHPECLAVGTGRDSRQEDEDSAISAAVTRMRLRQMALCSSLAILATASPKVSPFGAAFDREGFRACRRVRYSSFKRARRLLAASELAFIRSIVSWECWLGFFIGSHNWLETEIRNNDSIHIAAIACRIKV